MVHNARATWPDCLVRNGGQYCGRLWAFVVLVILCLPVPVAGQDAEEALGQDTAGIADEPAEAELQDIDLLDLEVPEVFVVTASRRKQSVAHVPYAVDVVTAEDIRQSGARCVPDALRLVPGVDVAELTYVNTAASLRADQGHLSNQVLVLVDGRQIYDSVFGGTVWGAWPFQLEDIERIEVVRGPGGVTWGANAINGVINIITKDPADQLGLTFTGGGGSRGTHKEHLGYAFAVDDKLRLRVSGEYEGSDGFRAVDPLMFRLSDDIQIGRMGVHAVYEPNDEDMFTISGGSGLTAGGRIISLAGRGKSSTNPVTQASYLVGTWRRKLSVTDSFELTGYVNDNHGDLGAPAVQHRYQQLAVLLSHQFALGDAHTITWGLDTRTDIIDTSNADPYLLTDKFISTAIIGMYVQDDWRFAPKWVLSLGGRLDYEFYGGFEPSTRASLSYDVTDTSMIYGAVSRAFGMSPGGARFLKTPLMGGLGVVTADRDVDAQIIWAYELGYRARFFDRLDTNLNLYWHEGSDLTALHAGWGPPGLLRMQYDNWGEASNYGVELDAKYAVTDKLTLLGHYTHQQYDLRSEAPFWERGIQKPPKHKFMLGARYSPTDDLHLSSHLYWVDASASPDPVNSFAPRGIDPYFRLDVRAEYELWDDRVSIAVGARNMLDEGHVEGTTMLLQAGEVPRMIYAEMRMRLQ